MTRRKRRRNPKHLGWWIAGGIGLYVASKFFGVTLESGTLSGKPYRILFSFYPPAAFGSGRILPRLVYTAQVDDAMPGSSVVSPFTIGSYSTRAADARAFRHQRHAEVRAMNLSTRHDGEHARLDARRGGP